MNANDTIKTARKHVSGNPRNESSARICLSDAISCYDNGDLDGAKARALKSLAYSVGIFHADYRKAM